MDERSVVKKSQPKSEASRKYYLVPSATRHALEAALAEARDAGVPAEAKVSMVVVEEGGLAAAVMAMAGQQDLRSYVTFTWED